MTTDRLDEEDSSGPVVGILCGAGAVENAWQPVVRALRPFYGFELTPDGANAVLARLVYLLRWWASSSERLGQDSVIVEYEKVKAFHKTICEAICSEIQEAEEIGELRVRTQFADVIDQFVMSKAQTFILINTNWDSVVDDAVRRVVDARFRLRHYRPLHIHGMATTPDGLYLPTEMAEEPYRSQSEVDALGTLHGSIMKGLEGAWSVLLYGLSMSPLDAELMQTFAAGVDSECIEEINIVAPDHDVVSHRVNLLLSQRKRVAVHGYHPEDLARATSYGLPWQDG